jgi:hypothetical protein
MACRPAILTCAIFDESAVMARPRKTHPPTPSDELEALLGFRWAMGRPSKHDLSTWSVSDDWPDRVPVTLAEIEVFERWFGDVLHELLGPQP